ncbi:MAG: hypothetical protein BMS9Abin28_0074 [Anaerolineae bacterium]|nr:MAG: hypothetical protein BMS9Abin28_0074 [Anaerolineae bacterium]
MTDKKLIDWPFVIGLLLLPVAFLLVLFAITIVQDFTRFDDSYFTAEYQARYETPSSVAFALEGALREADSELMTELLGTRAGPEPMEPRPSLVYVFLLGKEGDYFKYLYFNQDDFHRLTQYVKEENGRYVASESDLYFYMDSGRWQQVAGPLIAGWWILVIVGTGGMYIYRYMARFREIRFGG